ncbi:hypothetical protein BDB00DRAFT_837992 [Zychaea mexicana]|uniref:uncharacterized protein n=1 Tax=Zychaea mexicana TaxID=64656 RepID=UPI0022FE6C99|nr:uncharacterized protein BDB00DRAFT_837992 [Zychaea mexicana]KAI9490317.1 hypothetical protein BDB00DRAFT_837992 [Zychaea mexicana]
MLRLAPCTRYIRCCYHTTRTINHSQLRLIPHQQWRSVHSKRHLRPNEYELRVGFAIAILQDELPHFFTHGLTEHSIYSQNIVLSDPHYTRLSVPGKTAYLGIAETLRWSLRMYFDDIQMEITRLRVLPDKQQQGFDDDDNSNSPSPRPSIDDIKNNNNKPTIRHLEIRWRLEGVRHPSFFLKLAGPIKHYEGVFLYTFDQEGYIGEHRIEHIVPPPSRRILFVHSLGGRLRAYWEEMKRRRVPELSPGL